jgi:3-methylcrotonyl-CoA carboxylase alpha subunit
VKPHADGSVTVSGAVPAVDLRAEMRDGRLAVEPRFAGTGDLDNRYVATVVGAGDVRDVFAPGGRARLVLVDALAHAGEESPHAGHLTAPMSGTVVAVLVQPDDEVVKGAPLVVLEAMKMEHTIAAPAAGRVVTVHFAVGERVAEGADLVELRDE